MKKRRVGMSATPEIIREAGIIGGGNVSRGIRIAVDALYKRGLTVLNLTGIPATDEQIANGLVDPRPEGREFVAGILSAPIESQEDAAAKAEAIAEFAATYDIIGDDDVAERYCAKALISGPAALCSLLEKELHARGVTPFYFLEGKDNGKGKS
jgi:hypothetical protein